MTFVFKSIVVNTAVDSRVGLTEKPYAKVEVKKNGTPIDFKLSKYAEVEVTVSDMDYSAEYEITVLHSELTPVSAIKREVLLKLMRVEGAYSVRRALSSAIKFAPTIEKIRGAILASDVSESDKIRLSETIL